jgi:hypothetical protein
MNTTNNISKNKFSSITTNKLSPKLNKVKNIIVSCLQKIGIFFLQIIIPLALGYYLGIKLHGVFTNIIGKFQHNIIGVNIVISIFSVIVCFIACFIISLIYRRFTLKESIDDLLTIIGVNISVFVLFGIFADAFVIPFYFLCDGLIFGFVNLIIGTIASSDVIEIVNYAIIFIIGNIFFFLIAHGIVHITIKTYDFLNSRLHYWTIYRLIYVIFFVVGSIIFFQIEKKTENYILVNNWKPEVTSIEVGNWGDKRWLTNPGETLISSEMRYLNPVITYNSKIRKNIILYIKIIDPNGQIKRNQQTTPENFSYTVETLLRRGNNLSLDLSGWGNNEQSSYHAGEYLVEVWYNNEYLISQKVIIVH